MTMGLRLRGMLGRLVGKSICPGAVDGTGAHKFENGPGY